MMGTGRLCATHAQQVLDALREADQVLAILPPSAEKDTVSPEIAALIDEREEARKQGDYSRADALRTRIRELGYQIEDRADGPRVSPAAEG
jgi:cysteinyl-tRNA synthetase